MHKAKKFRLAASSTFKECSRFIISVLSNSIVVSVLKFLAVISKGSALQFLMESDI